MNYDDPYPDYGTGSYDGNRPPESESRDYDPDGQTASPRPRTSLSKFLISGAIVVLASLLLIFFLNQGGKPSRAAIVIQRVDFSNKTTKPGGAYFAQLAEALAGAGEIVGAVYDSISSRIVLVFRKNAEMPPLRIEDFAVAMRTVFADDLGSPAASIDPDPKNPLGDSMHVRFEGDVENTYFGWVMLEADRRMKDYSLGQNNLTHAAVASQVPSYYNLVQLSFSNLAGRYNPNIWSRFWLYARPLWPDSSQNVAVRVGGNWKSIYFEPVEMGVRTETMRWQGGKLVPAGGVKDDKAEYFANHFTNHYDDFAREDPIYAQLRRQMQLLAVAQWLKEADIPFDPYFIERFGRARFETPKKTPSLTVSGTRGNLTVQIFGGTDAHVEIFPAKDNGNAETLKHFVDEELPADKSQAVFDATFRGEEIRAAILPGLKTTIAGSADEAVTDLAVGGGNGKALTLTRYTNALHQEKFEFGLGATLNLSRLSSYNPASRRRRRRNGRDVIEQPAQYFIVNGKRVMVKKFHLYDALGRQQADFGRPQVDANGDIFFPAKDNEQIIGIFPQRDGIYEVRFRDGRQMFFNDRSPFIQREIEAGQTTIYEYEQGRLVRLRKGNQWIKLQYENGLVVRATASDGRVREYAYDATGRLKTDAHQPAPLLFTMVDASGKTANASFDLEAGVLSIDQNYPLDQKTGNLLAEFFEKEKQNLSDLQTQSTSIEKVFDLGGQGHVVLSGNRLYFNTNSINELKGELERFFADPNVDAEEFKALTTIYGRNAEHINSREPLLGSEDIELNILLNFFFRTKGKVAYSDGDLKAAQNNLQAQSRLDKSRPGLIIERESFKGRHNEATLRENSDKLEEEFRKNDLHQISSAFAEIPPEANLIVITAENDGELARRLQEAGPKLQGKHVLLLTCGDVEKLSALPEASHQIIANHKCLGVMSFYFKLEIEAARAVVKELIPLLKTNPNEPFEFIFDRAVDRAGDANKANEALRKKILEMKKHWHQISWDDDGQDRKMQLLWMNKTC